MAKLLYNKDGRLLFTKEMKKEYTILIPQMLPVTFALLEKCFQLEGFRTELLTTNHRGIVDTGLRYVHNDTCFPALLVIGQIIDAVQSGKYNVNKIAVMITQTGGGCRASNYIHLLRKALYHAGLCQIPVISLNISGLDRNPGFSLSMRMIFRLIYSIVYGDLIVNLANQCRPYEIEYGATDRLVQAWEQKLIAQYAKGKGIQKKSFRHNLSAICADFAELPLARVDKVKVGIVGEIYVKYAPLGNNNLEQFLLDEGCEPVVPGLLDFILFKINNRSTDVDLYGGWRIKRALANVLQRYIARRQQDLIDAISQFPSFSAPKPFTDLREGVRGLLGYGNKMGEGWLLPGEMIELIHAGVNNIVCTQPFGCLPNHIVGKGMIRAIRRIYPEANIVAVDYDPGATKINQENRIKLMLANAAKSLNKEQSADVAPLSPFVSTQEDA